MASFECGGVAYTDGGPVRRILVSNSKLSRQMRRANESAVIKNTIAGASQGQPSGREQTVPT